VALRRYSRTTILGSGTRYGTSDAIVKVREGVARGFIPVRTMVLAAGQRLDTIAGQEYGNSSLWWVIAAASGIGWAPQVPPGTVLTIPTSLGAVEQAVLS
jgi:nucleoid-associated protein YgaU